MCYLDQHGRFVFTGSIILNSADHSIDRIVKEENDYLITAADNRGGAHYYDLEDGCSSLEDLLKIMKAIKKFKGA